MIYSADLNPSFSAGDRTKSSKEHSTLKSGRNYSNNPVMQKLFENLKFIADESSTIRNKLIDDGIFKENMFHNSQPDGKLVRPEQKGRAFGNELVQNVNQNTKNCQPKSKTAQNSAFQSKANSKQGSKQNSRQNSSNTLKNGTSKDLSASRKTSEKSLHEIKQPISKVKAFDQKSRASSKKSLTESNSLKTVSKDSSSHGVAGNSNLAHTLQPVCSFGKKNGFAFYGGKSEQMSNIDLNEYSSQAQFEKYEKMVKEQMGEETQKREGSRDHDFSQDHSAEDCKRLTIFGQRLPDSSYEGEEDEGNQEYLDEEELKDSLFFGGKSDYNSKKQSEAQRDKNFPVHDYQYVSYGKTPQLSKSVSQASFADELPIKGKYTDRFNPADNSASSSVNRINYKAPQAQQANSKQSHHSASQDNYFDNVFNSNNYSQKQGKSSVHNEQSREGATSKKVTPNPNSNSFIDKVRSNFENNNAFSCFDFGMDNEAQLNEMIEREEDGDSLDIEDRRVLFESEVRMQIHKNVPFEETDEYQQLELFHRMSKVSRVSNCSSAVKSIQVNQQINTKAKEHHHLSSIDKQHNHHGTNTGDRMHQTKEFGSSFLQRFEGVEQDDVFKMTNPVSMCSAGEHQLEVLKNMFHDTDRQPSAISAVNSNNHHNEPVINKIPSQSPSEPSFKTLLDERKPSTESIQTKEQRKVSPVASQGRGGSNKSSTTTLPKVGSHPQVTHTKSLTAADQAKPRSLISPISQLPGLSIQSSHTSSISPTLPSPQPAHIPQRPILSMLSHSVASSKHEISPKATNNNLFASNAHTESAFFTAPQPSLPLPAHSPSQSLIAGNLTEILNRDSPQKVATPEKVLVDLSLLHRMQDALDQLQEENVMLRKSANSPAPQARKQQLNHRKDRSRTRSKSQGGRSKSPSRSRSPPQHQPPGIPVRTFKDLLTIAPKPSYSQIYRRRKQP